MNAITLRHSVNVKAEVVICNDSGHGHADNKIGVMNFCYHGHDIYIETERGSEVYNLFIDDDSAGHLAITESEVNALLGEL